jgi:runt-related transcription factor 1
MSIEEFQQSLQEVTSFPLRPFVLPFLRAHLPLLHRDITQAARSTKQSPLSYCQTHESAFIDTACGPGEPQDIFNHDPSDLSFKRKASEISGCYENGENSSGECTGGGGGYTVTPKRRHISSVFSPPFLLPSSSSADYYNTSYGGALTLNGNNNNAAATTPTSTTTSMNEIKGGGGGEEEWKNIHTMLNCILSMVEKTKRALGMLQSRAQQQQQQMNNNNADPWLRRANNASSSNHTHLDTSEELRRQVGEMMAQAVRATEDRVSEVKRKAGS